MKTNVTLLLSFCLIAFNTSAANCPGADTAACWPYIIKPDNHTIIISDTPTVNGLPLPNGSWIGAFFDDAGTLKCAGIVKWIDGPATSLTAFGDDAGGVKDGFSSDETSYVR